MLKLINQFVIFVIAMFCLTMNANASQVFQVGPASYYGKAHHGKRTASGERFNMYAMTAAHRTLPFGTKIRVTNEDTGKSIIVTVNDRGPYHGRRILDLSQEAARQLGMIKRGVGKVTIERIDSTRPKKPSPLDDPDLHEDIRKQLDPIEELITQLKVQ